MRPEAITSEVGTMNISSVIVGSEAITSSTYTMSVSSKTDERGESFPMRPEEITAEVGTINISSGIVKIGEGFPMRSSFQKLNRNFHYPRVSTGNVGHVVFL